MFNLTKAWGDHKIYQYDTEKHTFLEYLQKLYNSEILNELHFESEDFKKFNNQ